jgi:hypothetical protein
MTLRAIKRSAAYATIIVVPGAICWFINGGWMTELIAFVLTAPGEFINAFIYDLFPNISPSAGPYLAIGMSWVVYFGFFWLIHFVANYKGHDSNDETTVAKT